MSSPAASFCRRSLATWHHGAEMFDAGIGQRVPVWCGQTLPDILHTALFALLGTIYWGCWAGCTLWGKCTPEYWYIYILLFCCIFIIYRFLYIYIYILLNYYYFSFQTPPDKLSVSAFSDMISNNINFANNILILPAIIYIYIHIYIYIIITLAPERA